MQELNRIFDVFEIHRRHAWLLAVTVLGYCCMAPLTYSPAPALMLVPPSIQFVLVIWMALRDAYRAAQQR